jgi:hypothetical protein
MLRLESDEHMLLLTKDHIPQRGIEMRKAIVAAVGFGLLALAACDRGSQDQLNATDVNASESLDDLSNDAANAAGNLEAENAADETPPAVDNTIGPETPEDENIAGM